MYKYIVLSIFRYLYLLIYLVFIEIYIDRLLGFILLLLL